MNTVSRSMGGGWLLRAEVGVNAMGQPCLVGLAVERDPSVPTPARGLGSILWRSINVGEVAGWSYGAYEVDGLVSTVKIGRAHV